MGGTILAHKENGDKIYFAVLNSDDDLGGDVDERVKEQHESSKFVGMDKVIYFRKQDLIEEKVKALDDISPDVLYFPFENDTHQAHVEAARVGFAVARKITMTVLRYIATTSHSYYPNYLRVINFNNKRKLVSIFKSQLERKPKFMEIVEAQNRFFGSLIPGNGNYAEGFMLFRMVQK